MKMLATLFWLDVKVQYLPYVMSYHVHVKFCLVKLGLVMFGYAVLLCHGCHVLSNSHYFFSFHFMSFHLNSSDVTSSIHVSQLEKLSRHLHVSDIVCSVTLDGSPTCSSLKSASPPTCFQFCRASHTGQVIYVSQLEKLFASCMFLV